MAKLDDFRGTVLVQQGGQDVFALARGRTGWDPDEDIEINTRFQIASVSKMFTAAAVLLLVDRNKLSVDDPIGRWVPGSPQKWDGITLHQLMTHTGGLVHWRDIPQLSLTERVDPELELEIFGEAELLGAPGEKFSYSSPGFVLLAHAVQNCAEQDYAEFLKMEVFEPLGLADTFAGNGAGKKRLAAGHERGERVSSFELDVVSMGAGDIWSTVGDLAKWDTALLTGGILSDASRKAVFTPHALTDEELGPVRATGYGYGWYIATFAGRPMIFHGGDNSGFTSVNALLTDDDLRLFVLSNEAETDLLAVSGEVLLHAGWRGAEVWRSG
jgi:CubicO group peptidase (beta-lactamase class C family)